MNWVILFLTINLNIFVGMAVLKLYTPDLDLQERTERQRYTLFQGQAELKAQHRALYGVCRNTYCSPTGVT